MNKTKMENQSLSLPIVGVGASAGGLEAFTELLKHLPTDTGMGFVLVQHLDPKHESALTQLLARATSMPVREVTNNLRVEANHVYVIPPNTTLAIKRGVLKLETRRAGRTPPQSIDFFLESLAQDQRERAVGVILSGTATDGAIGLETIKAEGGIAFAQDESARYDSMPRNAVATGCVDFVLSPEKIAWELARIAKHPWVAGRALPSRGRVATNGKNGDEISGAPEEAAGQPAGGDEHNAYKKILLLLRNHSGVDFSLYKSATIQRRIARRMVLSKIETLEGYADSLRGHAKELDTLYSDCLISVTRFFRNPEAFDVLKRKIFPKLLQRRSDDAFRVWVLGCSTGQEAYSIAMAFMEEAEKSPRLRKLQIFATDLNEALLDRARNGLYAKNLAQDISPQRLRRFFVEEEGGYRITKRLREMVVFARQSLISDPPFSRMDLISCRNVLIYLEPELQKKAFPMFHYALKPEGFLLLGASESIGGFTDLFEPVDKKQKIYSRQFAPTPAFHLPVKKRPPAPGGGVAHLRGQRTPLLRAPEGFRAELSAQVEADRITVNQFAPPGVLINHELQILQFRGPTSVYLQPPAGKASFDVLKMTREGLMLPLRAAINKAKKENKIVRRENVRFDHDGKIKKVSIEVVPLKNLKERCFLVLFKDGDKAGAVTPSAPADGRSAGVLSTRRFAGKREESRRLAELERELAETRDYLQALQEQHESSNEELQASNEEVTSANEELQSLNEELETSKEELESANEELTTVNEEMSYRNAELSRLNADLNNLQTSTKISVILIGRDLTIRRFSPAAEKQFNLLAADIGQPLSKFRHNLVPAEHRSQAAPVLDLEAFAQEAIDTVRECECEVRDKDSRWFSLRGHPYLTLDNKIDGAVIAFVDIDALKRTERAIEAARDYAEEVLAREQEANRAKTDFLAALSHELRTPLNPVLLLASDSANDPDLSEQTRANFEAIRKNVELEARLIDDLLDVTRINHGKLVLNQSELDVHDTLNDSISTVFNEIGKKQILLKLELHADNHKVFGDAVRLQQIFWNVLKNAVKFTSEGGQIIVESQTLPGDKIVINITDTGIGMNSEEIGRVFGAFSQGSHHFGGLGLGLAISRALIELHSGSIRASSPGKGKGATFSIELPLIKMSEREEPARSQPAPKADAVAETKRGRPHHVLLVEDHESTRLTLVQLLLHRRYRVTAAASLAEARSLIQKNDDFNLLISDIGLPDGNGCDLMNEFEKQFGAGGIALTGYGAEQDLAQTRASGFTAHLTKPIRIESLEHALADALKGPTGNVPTKNEMPR